MDRASGGGGTATATSASVPATASLAKKAAKRKSKKQRENKDEEVALALVDHLRDKLQISAGEQEQEHEHGDASNGLCNGDSARDGDLGQPEPCERLQGGDKEQGTPVPVPAPAPAAAASPDRDTESLENGHPVSEGENQDRVEEDDIQLECYQSEVQMAEIMRLIQKDLSEPYSIYTYRYFIYNWPKLCFLAMHNGHYVGAIVCKLDKHHVNIKRGYIAMLAVDEKYRKRKIGSRLVRQAITAMIMNDADEVVLETEITNKPALRLYENLGFVRDKRLFRYYLNGVDALRLKLWLR